MIRQPKNPDKMYSVEAVNANGNPLCQDPCVYAQTPMDAAVFALRKQGFGISRAKLASIKNPTVVNGIAVAKVCLLAGTRESVSYFEIDLS